jgi:hypothetical protein
MYGPNITKTGVHSPPEAIYILGKDNVLFCFKRRRYGLFDSYYNTNLSENRNVPGLVQAFLKKWWVESDFKAPNLPLSLRLKVSGCHYSSIYNNTGTK